MMIAFKAAKLPNGKIVEVLGVSERGVSVCYEIFSDKALEMRQVLPLTTRFVWVRDFNFGDVK